MSDLSGKKGLILGVGNQRSIAWAMAEQLQQQGAELGLTFLSDPKAVSYTHLTLPTKLAV